MNISLHQESPKFFGLGTQTFAEGDTIVFDVGLVDIHSHGRDNNTVLGQGMTDILSHSAKQFSMVLLMPNLAGADALMTYDMAIAYYERAMREAGDMKILVTVYLNTNLTKDDIRRISDDPRIAGIKSYPAHATTNSEHGLRTPLEAPAQLGWMEEYGVPLLVHGQVRTREDGSVMDEFDRSPYFYEEVAPELDRQYPALCISYEHLDTAIGAETVVERKGPTQGTFTLLHLGFTRTDVMDTGVRTDMVMKPMVQHEREKPRLWSALRSRPGRFALGSDDAWHPRAAKHAKNCACGGCYGPYRVGYYLEVFEKAGALDLFGQFACVNAARFYGVEVPKKLVKMQKGYYTVAETLPYGKHLAEPLHAGEKRFGWFQL
jgi:dihydroorotase